MKINIANEGIIKEQELIIENKMSIIYGYNNSGKTSILRVVNKMMYDNLLKNFLNQEDYNLSLYIPTNRVIVSTALTENKKIIDIEDLYNYCEKDMYIDYSHHLKMIRDYLLTFENVRSFIINIIKKIFKIDITTLDIKYSDGIENVINIYLNIIWILFWDEKLGDLETFKFNEKLQLKEAFILIDELEMFLHVSVQTKLIQSLVEDFNKCTFVITTHSPLLLTRNRDATIYKIESGKLGLINNNLFYKDLDNIYESYFKVDELPIDFKNNINYLGEVIMNNEKIDQDRIQHIIDDVKENYPNLYQKYNRIMTIAMEKSGL